MTAKWPLATAGILVVSYAVAVLVYVVSTPDLRLRCLVIDPVYPSTPVPGARIQATLDLKPLGPHAPEAGDLLVQLNGRPIRTFMDVTRSINSLRNAQLPPGGPVPENTNPAQEAEDALPTLFEWRVSGRRFVEIAYVPQAELSRATSPTSHPQQQRSWLEVQSLPLGDVMISLVWFVLHLAALVLAALAFWKRPNDRPFRLFFAMSIVGLGAYVGGYHWWVISSNLWLNVPFVICAMLVPVVSLHFFLAYPRPKSLLSGRPRFTIAVLYTPPAIAILGVLSLLGLLRWQYGRLESSSNVSDIEHTLQVLVTWVYVYLVIGVGYFAVMLATLWYSYNGTRNPMERGPLKWLLGAGLISAVLIGFCCYFAIFRPVAFALGAARVPMFLASLSFLVAYVVGITRYRMLLVDEVVSKGVWYYTASYGLTAAFCFVVALSTLLPQYLNISLSAQQAVTVASVLMVFVLVLLWIRDRFQQIVDRRFFREKYQLDKALTRMNRTVGRLSDPETVVQMMLGSCRDVLGVEQAALYLRTSSDEPFQLIAADGGEKIPLELEAGDELIAGLSDGGSVQRVTPDTRSEMSPLQHMLRDLRAGLIHTLEVEWGMAGLIVLGEKKNFAPFTAEDLTFLHALGQITNVAFHSAKVDQEISRLNEELRSKLDRISAQNRQITILQTELASRSPEMPGQPAAADGDNFRREVIRGSSPAILNVLETARKVALSESSVLLRGESGTGKELLARVLHNNSPRRAGPMVAVHCASLSPTLLESELFGHVKGSFTGADRDRIGRFEMANGGTLFLDEIGDIPLDTQIKLLRVLQERCFEPVGGTRTIQVDVRVVTATHQDLERLITEGRFREDLYYRLNVISVMLPPLRERMEDIYELAIHFLRKSTQRVGKRILDIDSDALAVLEQHNWPGNIRELENVIERAVVLSETDRITLRDLPAETARRHVQPAYALETKLAIAPTNADRIEAYSGAGSAVDSAAERELLKRALAQCGGNKAEAARKLGMPRSTYFSKLKKYAIA